MLSIVLKNLYRRPRHSLTIIIGIVLAVALLTGINLTINSMTTIYFTQELEKEPLDFIIHGDIYNVTQLPDVKELKEDVLNTDPNIVAVEILWMLDAYGEVRSAPYVGENVSEYYETEPIFESFIVAGVPLDFGSSIGTIVWEKGNMSDDEFHVAIEKSLAVKYNLTVGDTFYITNVKTVFEGGEYKEYINNLEVKVSGIFEVKDKLEKIFEVGRYHYGYGEEKRSEIIILSTFENAYKIWLNNSGGEYYLISEPIPISSKSKDLSTNQIILPIFPQPIGNFRAYVFIDRDSVIDPWNLDVTQTRVNAIDTKLQLTAMKYGFSVSNRIENVFTSVQMWSQGMRTTFGVFSAPTILLGGFLAITSVYLILEQRRRDVGLYKVRGMTDGQVRKLILEEGLVLGVIAGILGYALGYAFNYYFTTRFLEIWNITDFPVNIFAFSTFDFILGLGIAIVLALFASWFPAKAASKLPVIEAIEEYSEEIAIERWKPKWTILWLILGTYKIIAWIVGFNSSNLMFQIGPISNFIIIIILGIFIFIDVFILQYIGPLLFIYSATKIVTMKLDSFSKWLERIINPLSSGLGGIVVRTISRKPRRYARVAFIIALTLGFGIASSIVQASNYYSMIKNVKASVGADINVNVWGNDINYYANITTINGVSLMTPIYINYYSIGDFYMNIYAIDPENFSIVTKDYSYPDYTVDKPFEECLETMKDNPKMILVNDELLRNLELDIGDNLTLTFKVNQTSSISLTFQILAKIKTLPGAGRFFGLFTNLVVLNYNYLLDNGVNITIDFWINSILVDVEENANATKIAEEIKDMYPEAYVTVAEEELAEVMSNPTYSATLMFLDTEYVITLFIATIGIGLLITMSVIERRKEFGILIAKGTSSLQIMFILLAESLILMLISVTIGVITGVAAGYGWATFASTFAFITVQTEVVIPVEVYYLIFGGFASFIIATLIPAYIASRTNIREALHLG